MAMPMNAAQIAPIEREQVAKKKPMPHGGAMKAAAMFRKGAAKKKAPLPPAPMPAGDPMGGPGY